MPLNKSRYTRKFNIQQSDTLRQLKQMAYLNLINDIEIYIFIISGGS